MSPTGTYDHSDRVGVRTRCSICGALGVNRTTCPKTTPEDHLAQRKQMNSYRKKSKRVADPDAPRYPREWQSLNNGDDLTLHLRPIDPPSQNGQNRGFLEIPLKIRLKIEVVFE